MNNQKKLGKPQEKLAKTKKKYKNKLEKTRKKKKRRKNQKQLEKTTDKSVTSQVGFSPKSGQK